MKRIIIAGFYLILTLIISAAGFFLPASLSAYQDQQIFATIEHPSIEPMEFTYSSSLVDTLQLFAKGCYFVDYPRTGSVRTSDEITLLVKDAFHQLEDYGIAFLPPESSAASYNISLQLAIASEDDNVKASGIETETAAKQSSVTSDPAKRRDLSISKSNQAAGSSDLTTAVIWNCFVYHPDGYQADIKIDDKSGKIVAFYLYTDQTSFSISTKKNLNQLVKFFRLFLQDYYEMKTKAILQNTVQTTYGIYDKSGTQPAILEADYTIQLTEESGNLIQIPFSVRSEHMSLN